MTNPFEEELEIFYRHFPRLRDDNTLKALILDWWETASRGHLFQATAEQIGLGIRNFAAGVLAERMRAAEQPAAKSKIAYILESTKEAFLALFVFLIVIVATAGTCGSCVYGVHKGWTMGGAP